MAYFTLNSNWQLLASNASVALLQSLDECRIYCGTKAPTSNDAGVLLTDGQEPISAPVGEFGGSIWGRGSGGLRAVFNPSAKIADGSTPPPPATDKLLISGAGYSLAPFTHQNGGSYSLADGGKTLKLTSNAWTEARSPAGNVVVTSKTMLRVSFSSSKRGEIHGIEFDTDKAPTRTRGFQFYGTQTDHYVQDFHTYNGSGTKTYEIPVGKYFTGSFRAIVFACDDDKKVGANSTFSNIELFEA